MTLYPQGTTAHCNRCDKAFLLQQPCEGYSLDELDRIAARLTGFATCPQCGAMDTHWIYAKDYLSDEYISSDNKIKLFHHPDLGWQWCIYRLGEFESESTLSKQDVLNAIFDPTYSFRAI